MLSMYPACFFKEEQGYSVIFSDLDLVTCGETINEAMAMAIDCLAGRLRWLRQDGEPLPEPSPMNSIKLTAVAKELEIEPQEAFVNIPEWLNAAALEMNLNLSQVLQEALLAKVQAR